MNQYTEEQIHEALSALNSEADKNEKKSNLWRIHKGKLSKSLRFKNFRQAFSFMSQMAIFAEEINHHPDWRNIYNLVEIDLITHDIDALSELDFQFAQKINTTLDELYQ